MTENKGLDGNKTFSCKENHKPSRGIIGTVIKNVSQAAPRLVAPVWPLQLVLQGKLKNHNEDQDKVVGHRDDNQIQGTGS